MSVLIDSKPVSVYVRRCQRCRVVKGNSSFPDKHGKRSMICRWCLAGGDKRPTRADRERDGRLRQLRRTRRDLLRQLDGIARKIERLERSDATNKSVA